MDRDTLRILLREAVREMVRPDRYAAPGVKKVHLWNRKVAPSGLTLVLILVAFLSRTDSLRGVERYKIGLAA